MPVHVTAKSQYTWGTDANGEGRERQHLEVQLTPVLSSYMHAQHDSRQNSDKRNMVVVLELHDPPDELQIAVSEFRFWHA